MKAKKQNEVALPWLGLTLFIAVIVRIYNLAGESLWIDEGNSLRDAHSGTISSQSKPLYYAILKLWTHVTYSEFGLRFLAVIFGVAGVIAIYLCGRAIFSKRVGVVAALIMAVSPLHVNHSQEIRMYTLLTFCSLISMYTFFLMMREWSLKRGMVYVLSTLATLLTHPLTAFMLCVQGIYALMHWRDKRLVMKGLACIVFAFLLWSPMIPVVMNFGHKFVSSSNWAAEAEKLTPMHVPLLTGQFMYGEWNRLSYADRLILRHIHYVYAFSVMILAFGVGCSGRRRKEMWYVGLWAFLPLVLMITMSLLINRSWPVRYLIYTSPALYLLVAWPIATAPRKILPIFLALVLCVPCFRLLIYYKNTDRAEWRPAVKYLDAGVSADDVVSIYKPSNQHVFKYYYHGTAPWRPIGPRSSTGLWGNFETRVPQRVVDASLGKKRSWLIVSRSGDKLPDQIYGELQRRGLKVEARKYYDLAVFRVDR